MQRTHKLMVFFPLLSVTEMLLTYQVQVREYKTIQDYQQLRFSKRK